MREERSPWLPLADVRVMMRIEVGSQPKGENTLNIRPNRVKDKLAAGRRGHHPVRHQ